MPRPPRPWHHSARDWWYVTVNGKRTRLGVRGRDSEPDAHAAWQALLRAAETLKQVHQHYRPDPESGDRHTLREVVAAYLASPDLRVCDATRVRLRWSLNHFAAVLGDSPITAITPRMVETALPETLSASSRHGAIGDLLGCLAWAGVVVGKVRRPPKESRGADCVLTPTQYEVVRALAGGDLRPLVVVLWETGCRPGEAAALTAENVDWPNAVARLRAHKTRRHTGRDRLVVLTPPALAALEAQRARYGSGVLFRTSKGKPFDVQRVNQRFRHLAERAGFRIMAYSFRHTFITRALEAGVPDATVAALVGHTSTATIHKHYSHVGENVRLLREQAERVSRARPAG